MSPCTCTTTSNCSLTDPEPSAVAFSRAASASATNASARRAATRSTAAPGARSPAAATSSACVASHPHSASCCSAEPVCGSMRSAKSCAASGYSAPCCAGSRNASSAARNSAPCSPGSRARSNSEPSSAQSQLTERRAVTAAAASAPAARASRTTRSRWLAVPANATSSRSPSVSGVAIRVIARAFAYEIRPVPKAAVTSGNVGSVRATRSCSRAVRRSIPTRQDSQCAHERSPGPVHAPLASNSASSSRNRHCAAARCPANPTSWASSSGVLNSATSIPSTSTCIEPLCEH